MSTLRPIRLGDPDIAILCGLFESRAMTGAQIAEIHFDGRREAVKKRLQKLKAANLICGRRRSPSDPAILAITRKGLGILREKGILASYPPFHLAALEKRARVSDFTLSHELQVIDVKAAFNSAVRERSDFSITEFCTWPLLHQFEAVRSGYQGEKVLVKPDGFIRIHESKGAYDLSEHTFFLEVDRSTETLETLVARARCYLSYYKSGGFAVRNGGDPSSFTEYPFRVLMVFKSAERRNNIAERLLELDPPILTQVWLSTFEEVASNPLGAIWIQPLDYREAVSDTRFELAKRSKWRAYQRQTARDLLVSREVKKRAILPSGQ